MVQLLVRKHYLYTGIGEIVEAKLQRITELSSKDAKIEFTSLYHLLNKELLMQCH